MKKRLLISAIAAAIGLSLTAGAITHTILTSYQTGSGSLTGSTTVTSDTEQNADVTLTAGTSNQVLAVSLNVSNAQSLCLFCTQPCTVQLYNADVLWNTVSLTANSPSVSIGSNQVWTVMGTNEITSLHLWPGTNSSVFSMRSVVHNGP
jgi:hypothetical protein